MLDVSKKISNTLLELFSELPDIEVHVQEDLDVLTDIERKKRTLAKEILTELQVEGIDNLSSEQIIREIQKGAKFKRFKYCHSFILVTYNKTSPVIFIKSSEGSLGHAMPYLLQSLFLGWWGFPWGPIYTIGSIFQNLFGGEDLTADVVKILKDSGATI
jgi:hypothetical protein